VPTIAGLAQSVETVRWLVRPSGTDADKRGPSDHASRSLEEGEL
jgi:hypothetical protein